MVRRPPILAERGVALIEVLLCSDYPTQLVLEGTLLRFGMHLENPDGTLNLPFVAAVSLLDSVLLIGLILAFLMARGERPRDVLFGPRPVVREALRGVPMIMVAFGLALVTLLLVRFLAPSLHTVERNPLQDLMRTPHDAAIFGLVVVIAGGVREEVQRAFLLHRFEHWLGGGMVGLIVTSTLFGAGHFAQGLDAILATACLGAFWGWVYLRRRSVAAPMVSHAGFNLVQLVEFVAGAGG
jgi:membrane protease YdiL (CAAX protease family)